MTPNLPRSRILRGRGAFSEILLKGGSVNAGCVKLFFVPASPPTPGRVGFAVQRGIKSAVMRNRIKRCLRESYRIHQQQDAVKPKDMVILYTGKVPRRSSEIDCTKIERDVLSGLESIAQREH